MGKAVREQTTRSSTRSVGRSFERAVQQVLQMLDPRAQVSHDEFLEDRLGHKRQFDIVIRGQLAGRDILGVVECKDHKRRVGAPSVEAFVTKANDVRANLTLFASKRGFTRPALDKARHYGIGTVSLMPNDKLDPGFVIGLRWYVEIYEWAQNTLTIHWENRPRSTLRFDGNKVAWRGRPLVNWWARELSTRFAKRNAPGAVQRTIRFRRPRRLTLDGRSRRAVGATFRSTLRVTIKTKCLQVSGTGLIDWDSEAISMPVASPLTIRLGPGAALSIVRSPACQSVVDDVYDPLVKAGSWFRLAPGEATTLRTLNLDTSDWEVWEKSLPAERNLGLSLVARHDPRFASDQVPELTDL